MHRHWCEVRAHKYECSDGACMCPCGSPMEAGDHSDCPVELRPCPEHRSPLLIKLSGGANSVPDWLQITEKSGKQQQAERILMQLVFYDLRLVNDDIGAPIFKEEDFLRCIDRCELLGIQIFSVDTQIPAKEIVMGTEQPPEGTRGAAWCRTALRGYFGLVDVAYAPTFGVPMKFFDVF
jgi:hypothetical protein